MTSLRATNWLNAINVGTPDAEGWLAVCPMGDVSEAEVRQELARLGHATEDRAGHVCVQRERPLERVKSDAIAANRAECRARIVAVWPEDRQRSAALGVYPPAECQACANWIAAHVEAENAAADLIDVAADAAAVAAVKVMWP